MRVGVLLVGLGALAVACGKDTAPGATGHAKPSGQEPDAGTAGTGSGDGGPDCFTNPTTHYEIINACTTAEYVDKHPDLPLLLPDGGLPPLP